MPEPGADGPPTLAGAWTLDPWLLLPLLLFAALHALGLWRLRRQRARPGPVTLLAAAAGWTTLALALVWPFDAYGEWSLAAHMTQHMLLMAAVPPLLFAGALSEALLQLFPPGLLRAAGGGLRAARGGGASLPLLAATLLQAAVMVLWHWPPWMQAALASDPLHYLMHASFLGAGMGFWWCLQQSLRAPRLGYGGGALAVLSTMMPMGLVGALLTFAPRPLYPHYLGRSELLGLAPLADQQLAGLVMWVPATLPYLIGGLWLLRAWLRRLEARQRAWPAR